MPFDENLVLADDTGDWTYANVVTSTYGTPTSTTRNSGGFAVIDLGGSNIWSDRRGLAIVVIFLDSAGASDDALTLTAQESEESDFGNASYNLHELCEFDILAGTRGVILGSEIPATVVRRVFPRYRYIRLVATMNADDNFGTVHAMISPYPVVRL